HLLTCGAKQKRGLPILRPAPNRRDEMTEEAARQLRSEQDGRLARGDPPAAESAQRAFRRLAPDLLVTLQVLWIASAAEPVVALHVVALLGQQHAAETVTRAGVALEETMRV